MYHRVYYNLLSAEKQIYSESILGEAFGRAWLHRLILGPGFYGEVVWL